MRTTGLIGLIALAGIGACYQERPYYTTPGPAAYQPQPVTVSGPPGGEMDNSGAYQNPDQPGYPAGYPPGTETQPVGDGGDPSLNSQAADPNAAPPSETATVTDSEIDQTLTGQGEWIVTQEYGRVWRPSATVVGVNFTPYDTCGRWVYTDYGWTFQACDEWASWGWLAFHYGAWDWYDGGWCWVPDYYWGPAWVDWRYGNGYVGWRPQRPRYHGTVTRDNRHGGDGRVTTRDYRHHSGRSRDSDWRFSHENDFGRRSIRGQAFTNPAEGLRVTNEVSRPPLRGNTTVSAASVMRGRQVRQNTGGFGPRPPAARNDHYSTSRPEGVRTFPTYRPPRAGSYNPPSRSVGTYNPPPSRGYNNPGTYNPPSRGTYNPPSRSTYNPPSRSTYNPPSRGTYNPPSRSTYSPPSRSTYSPPSHSSSSSSHSSGGGSHSSSSSSSHSSSSSSHSSGSSHSSSSSHSSGGHHK
jgi:hypothetical protein